MAHIQLIYVDRLLQIRRELHGGNRGAPPIEDGVRRGEELNKACIIMLSAALQAYVEDVFMDISCEIIGINEDKREIYKKSWERWGNPSPSNIISLFRRIGIENVLHGLSWRSMSNKSLKENLDKINVIRNQIAHGRRLRYKNNIFNLHSNQVTRWRNICQNFGERFEYHVRSIIS